MTMEWYLILLLIQMKTRVPWDYDWPSQQFGNKHRHGDIWEFLVILWAQENQILWWAQAQFYFLIKKTPLYNCFSVPVLCVSAEFPSLTTRFITSSPITYNWAFLSTDTWSLSSKYPHPNSLCPQQVLFIFLLYKVREDLHGPTESREKPASPFH